MIGKTNEYQDNYEGVPTSEHSVKRGEEQPNLEGVKNYLVEVNGPKRQGWRWPREERRKRTNLWSFQLQRKKECKY